MYLSKMVTLLIWGGFDVNQTIKIEIRRSTANMLIDIGKNHEKRINEVVEKTEIERMKMASVVVSLSPCQYSHFSKVGGEMGAGRSISERCPLDDLEP
jgi:hypothetical protein